MKIIILLLIPSMLIGMCVPSSGGVCDGLHRTQTLAPSGYPKIGESRESHFGGAQPIETQSIDPYYLSQMTRKEQMWFIAFMIVTFVVVESINRS